MAIWGERFRAWFAGPKIELSLNSSKGELTKWRNGERTIYYHILVTNKRRWASANNVRVLCNGVSKKRADGNFAELYLTAPDQLVWRFPQFHELAPTVISSDICDFGYGNETSAEFRLALYVYPNSFEGSIAPNQAMRVSLIASGSNFVSEKPCILEVSWNGKWTTNLEENQNNLVIKRVSSLVGI